MNGQMRVGAEIEGEDAALAVAAALDDLAGAVSAFETREATSGDAALWRVEAYPAAPILNPALEIRLALLAAGAGGRLLDIREERLGERDWLEENRRAFPPLRIGRFFVHGSHWTGRAPPRLDPSRNRRRDRLRHRRASLDARRSAGARRACAPAPLPPAARYRHRHRRAGDRRRKAVCTAPCWRATSIAPRRGSPRTMSGATVCAGRCA